MTARASAQFLEADAQGHGAAITNCFLGHLDEFPNDAAAVLDRAAILVLAPIVFRDQELIGR
jgi:hypothetical protein